MFFFLWFVMQAKILCHAKTVYTKFLIFSRMAHLPQIHRHQVVHQHRHPRLLLEVSPLLQTLKTHHQAVRVEEVLLTQKKRNRRKKLTLRLRTKMMLPKLKQKTRKNQRDVLQTQLTRFSMLTLQSLMIQSQNVNLRQSLKLLRQ